jgi:hypothetical protein
MALTFSFRDESTAGMKRGKPSTYHCYIRFFDQVRVAACAHGVRIRAATINSWGKKMRSFLHVTVSPDTLQTLPSTAFYYRYPTRRSQGNLRCTLGALCKTAAATQTAPNAVERLM